MVPRNLVTGLFTGDWLFVAFDLTMLALSASFGWAAYKMARTRAAAAPRRARRETELAAA